MGIIIDQITHKVCSGNTINPFLKGTVGEWGVMKCNFTAGVYMQPDRGASISVVKPNILRIENGDNWVDYGFAENDTTLFSHLANDTDQQSTELTVTYRFVIDYLDDNIMYVRNMEFTAISQSVAIPFTPTDTLNVLTEGDSSYPGVTQIGDSTVNFYNVLIRKETQPETFPTIDVNYAKVKNSERGTTEVNAAIDGTEPLINFEGIQSFSGGNGELRAVKSGSFLKNAAIFHTGLKTVKIGSYNLNIPSYTVEFLYNMALFGEQYEFNQDKEPDYFFDRQSLSEGLIIKCFRFKDDVNVNISQIKKLKKGQVGYKNENFKGIVSRYTPSEVTYFDQDGNEDFSLAYNAESSIEFNINIGDLTANTTFQFGLAVIPASYQTNKSTGLENYQLVTGKTGFENYDYTDGSMWNIPFNNYKYGDIDNLLKEGFGGVDMNHVSITKIAPKIVRVRLKFKSNGNTELGTGDYFAVFANINGSHNVIADYQNFKEYENIIGDLNGDMRFFPSYLDPETDNGLPMPDITTVQDGFVKGFCRVNSSEDIKSVSFRMEAKIGNLEYTLQRDDFDIPEGTTQDQIQETKNTNISGLAEGREDIMFQREDALDASNSNGFIFSYPVRSRWEYWIERLDTPDNWFNPTEPNYGRNNDWFGYTDVAGTEITFSMYVEVEEGFYVKRWNQTPRDYNSSDVTTLIEVYRTSDDQLLWESTNSDGFDVGYLIQDQDMYIKATHTNPGGWSDASGDITIERLEQNGQYEIRSTFSEITQPDTEPLGEITKNIVSNDLILQADLAGAFINPEFNYVIKSRSFNKYDGDIGIPTVTPGYNPFSDNFANNFTAAPSNYFG